MIKASENIAIISGDRKITFSDTLRHITHFAHHTPQEREAKTLIFSENREGWIYAAFSVWCNHGIVVPVDAGSTVHDVSYIISDCHPQAIWTSKERLPIAEEAIKEAGVDVRILLIDDHETTDVQKEEMAEITYQDSDTCLICYTSGTTGSPKGVMLTFTNIFANIDSVSKEVPIFTTKRRTLILLPLHHVLPLVGSMIAPMTIGGGVAICPTLAAADIMGTLQQGKIGIMIGVPRLWQTLFRGIKAKIDAKWITRKLFDICQKAQSRTLSRIIFKSVHTKMGGHLDYCVSGGAALDAETALGLKTLGLDVLEGYGMTETAPIIAFTRPDDIRPGCVGLPLPSVEVKLVDGELCARGRNVMKGYYNRPEETAAIIDKDGFIHTGDLATIDSTNHIVITGRRKEIIVLSNGKNINPVEIEEKIEHYSTMVKEVAVTQDGDMLKAIIVPADAWKAGKTGDELEESLKREVLQPYNETVAPYKKVMSLMVYHGELPRTRLDKIQRFKLKDIIAQGNHPASHIQPSTLNHQPSTSAEYDILSAYIKGEKHVDVRPTDNLETDLAMDSLDKVALQGFIEQTFGMDITADQITQCKDVEHLAHIISESKTRMDVEDFDWHKLLQDTKVKRKKLQKMPPTGLFFTSLCRTFYKFMFHPSVKGLENIPSTPVIFAPNHQSFLDGPLVVTPLKKHHIRRTFFYAKKDHVHGPLMRLIARNHNIVIMDLSKLKDSIPQLAGILRQGGNLVIFPEGTRTHDGSLGTYKKTFAILSKELGIPVVPVRIDGAFEAWPRDRRLPRRHPITVEYLPAITPAADDTYDSICEKVRAKAMRG